MFTHDVIVTPSVVHHDCILHRAGKKEGSGLGHETAWNGNIFRVLVLCEGNPSVTVGLHSQRPVTRSIDGFFTLRLNKQLSKQSIRRWFETPSCSLWRHCNGHGNAFHIIGRLQIIVCDRNPLVTEWLYHKWPRMWTVDTFCVVSRSKLLKNRSSYQLDVRTLNTTWIYQWATIGDTE